MRMATALIMTLMAMAGCSTKPRECYRLMNQGYSEDYADGCVDGVSTARHKFNKWYPEKKDDYRYANSEEYRRGWDYGYKHLAAPTDGPPTP